MASSSATRGAPRRPLQLPLRFVSDAQLVSALSVNVSATGMYVNASHIPSAGELVRLSIVPRGTMIRADLFGEVRWGRSTPTLDLPRPGFGFHFIEVSSEEDNLEALARLLENFGLSQARELIQLETRHNVRVALYRSP